MEYPPFAAPASPAAAATDAVRRYCRWHVAPVVSGDVVTLRGHSGDSLILPTFRLVELERVEVDVADGLGWRDVPPDEIVPDVGGVLMRRAGWGSRWWRWRVTMAHGFDAASDLGQLVADVAARAAASPAGHTQVTVGGVTTVNGQVAPGVSGGVVLMAHEREKLDAYRLPGVST